MRLSSRWITILLILPHIKLNFPILGDLDVLFEFWRGGIIIAALFIVFKQLTVFNLWVTSLMGITFLSALYNGTLTTGVSLTLLIILSFCVYISYAIKDFNELITGLYYLFSIAVIGNFVTMIIGGVSLDPKGYPEYLFGPKNAVQLTVLPSIVVVYLYSYFKYNKIRKIPLFVVLIGLFSIFLSGSGTGIVVTLLSIIFIFFPKKVFPTFDKYLIVYCAMFLSVVIFRFQEVLFGDFITNVLHKDLTFTRRTYVWDFIINETNKSWLVGIGRGNSAISNNFPGLSETHNGFLEIYMCTGIIGVVIFLSMLLLIGKELKAFKKNIFTIIISFSLFAYMMIGLQESVFYKTEFWMILTISCGIRHIANQSRTDINQQLLTTKAVIPNEKCSLLRSNLSGSENYL